MEAAPPLVRYDLADLKLSPTAALFEGEARAGIGLTIFVVCTPPGRRNVGDVPLLVVSVHESGTLAQTFLGVEPQ